MVRFLKIAALGLLVAFIALQFFRPAKNLQPGPDPKDDVFVRYPAAPGVRTLVQTACYDCHSNRTRYPWYAEIQPVGWYLADHVKDGKAELNFSEFGALTPKRQSKALLKVSDEITDHNMPLSSYTLIHRDAKLSEAQIKTLTEWAEALADEIGGE